MNNEKQQDKLTEIVKEVHRVKELYDSLTDEEIEILNDKSFELVESHQLGLPEKISQEQMNTEYGI